MRNPRNPMAIQEVQKAPGRYMSIKQAICLTEQDPVMLPLKVMTYAAIVAIESDLWNCKAHSGANEISACCKIHT